MAQCIQQINTSSPILQPINKEIKGRGLEGKKIKSPSIFLSYTSLPFPCLEMYLDYYFLLSPALTYSLKVPPCNHLTWLKIHILSSTA